MNQVPCVPICNPCQVQQPQYMPIQAQPQKNDYNAVKIDIHNPSVGNQQPCCQAPVVYDYPQAPVYNYPVAQTPVYYPPVQQPVQQPQVVNVPQPVQIPTQVPAAPEVQQPVVIQPAPAVINNNGPVNNVPATQVPEPTVTKPEIVPPETVAPQVDINSFIAKLANPDFDTQKAGMEEIAAMVGEKPDKATELVDTKVFDALNNIINADTSALEGPSQAQIDARQKIIEGKDVTNEEKALANTITPKEQAERNKSYALFTTAIMDKLYADEVKKLSDKTVPLTELPGVVTVVDQLKDNPNPMVRASAIEALSYLQNPEYKNDLNTLFTVAKNDQDPGVAEAANVALGKLAQA